MYHMNQLNSHPSLPSLGALTLVSQKHQFYCNRAQHLSLFLRFVCLKTEEYYKYWRRQSSERNLQISLVQIRCSLPAVIVPLSPSFPSPLSLFGYVFLSDCDSAVAERGQSICKRWTQPSFSSSFLLMAIIRRLAAVPETCSSCSPAAVSLLHKASILRGSLGVMPRKWQTEKVTRTPKRYTARQI